MNDAKVVHVLVWNFMKLNVHYFAKINEKRNEKKISIDNKYFFHVYG